MLHLVSERAGRPAQLSLRLHPLGLVVPLSLVLVGLAPAWAAEDPPPDCAALLSTGDGAALRQRQLDLVAATETPATLEGVLQAAEELLACAAPQTALDVLARVSPAAGEPRRRWLVMQWRAAQAGLSHGLAVQALTLLAEGDLRRLEDLPLPLGLPGQTSAATRPALDLLADHLESLGQPNRAARVLLSSSAPGATTAARWGRAVALATAMPLRDRDEILERALEQAAAANAWGLVAALLDQQLADGVSDPASTRALERRLRLGQRIDDAYGEWLQRRQLSGPEHQMRNQELERQLRSPREPGGHAGPALSPDPSPPSTLQP